MSKAPKRPVIANLLVLARWGHTARLPGTRLPWQFINDATFMRRFEIHADLLSRPQQANPNHGFIFRLKNQIEPTSTKSANRDWIEGFEIDRRGFEKSKMAERSVNGITMVPYGSIQNLIRTLSNSGKRRVTTPDPIPKDCHRLDPV